MPNTNTVPYSNGDVERVSRQMNIIRTNLGNKVHVKTLNAILRIVFVFQRIKTHHKKTKAKSMT